MKVPSIAPGFAFLYPILCNAAQDKGYALALHGSMQRDLDVIAVPWVYEAASADELVAAIKSACGGWIVHRPEGDDLNDGTSPTPKPHGRVAWSIYIQPHIYIDLSVMPIVEDEQTSKVQR